jgi:cytochrome c6
MNKTGIWIAVGLLTAGLAMANSQGQELFKKHCAVCHPNGGNTIKPEKTLQKATLEANGIKTVDDIIGTMRNPGPGMNAFDEKALPPAEARAIAEYVQETFK